MTTAARTAIQWLPWGQDAFRKAMDEDKLILLDSGATWCHWCHVMDLVTYDDEEVVRIVQERFVPVRIDRDRLSDVDSMLQKTPSLIGAGQAVGGWPLTVVMTPEGHILYKATFVPPRADLQIGASAGLADILPRLDEYWQANRTQITTAAAEYITAIRQQQDEAFSQPGTPSENLVDQLYAGLRQAYDPQHGGFGDSPKFFTATALELLQIKARGGDDIARAMLEKTLDSIARGGVYDHLGGGFHRYSVDRFWHVPHFEKMAYDNAAMLAVYANAYAFTGREDFAQAARGTIDFIAGILGGRGEARGFFASQDADVGLEDDGDHFTWTLADFRRAAGRDADAAIVYYDVDEAGDMHDRPGRNVLHVPKTFAQHAALTGVPAEQLAKSVGAARRRLLAARNQRPTPAVDKTIFADLNGMLIDALLTAAERMGDATAAEMALAKIEPLLMDLRDPRGVFAHYRQQGELCGVGLLADQAWMGKALLHAFCYSGHSEYLQAAQAVCDYIVEQLTASDGGLLSGPQPADDSPTAVPPNRPWEDAPCRSAASVAAQLLLDMGHLTGKDKFSAAGAAALSSFAGAIEPGWGTFLAGYATTVDHLLHGPRVIAIVGPAGETQELLATARRAAMPGSIILPLDPQQPDHAAIMRLMGLVPRGKAVAYVCGGHTCLPPAATASELTQRLSELP